MPRHIVGVNVKLEIVSASQSRDERLIRIRLRPAQFVIEMNNRKDNAQLAPQLQQQAQERHRINPTGDGDADAIPSPQQFLPPKIGKHALRQGMHGNMVHRRLMTASAQPATGTARAAVHLLNFRPVFPVSSVVSRF